MPKSKKRGGAKAHRKRVQARNERLKGEKNRMQKMQQAFFQQMLKEMEEGKFEDTQELPSETSEEKNNGDLELQGGEE